MSNPFHYRLLARSLPDTLVILFDENLSLLLVEGAGLPGASMSRDAVLDDGLAALPDQMRGQVEMALRAALVGDETRLEVSINERVVECHVFPLAGGEGAGDVGSLVTTSPRETAEVAPGAMAVLRDLHRDWGRISVLHASHARLQAVLDRIPTMIYIKDLAGRYVLMNQANADAFGLSPAQVRGKTSRDVLPAELADQFEEEDRRVLERREVQRIEHHLHLADGPHTLLSVQFPLLDDAGQPYAVCGFATDITTQKETEAELRQAGHRNRLLKEAIDAAVDHIYIKDRAGRFVFANRATLDNLGFETEAEVIGRTDNDLLDRLGYNQAVGYEAEQRIMQTGESIINYRVNLCAEHEDCVRWMLVSKMPIRDEHGRTIGLVGVNRDITEQHETELALAKSQQRFRTVVDSMDDIIFTLDREQRHTGVFGRWLETYNIAPEAFLGKTAAEMMGPVAADVHIIHNQRALAGEHVVYEWPLPVGDEVHTIQTSLSPIYTTEGGVDGLVGVGRNITEIKRAEDAISTLNNTLLHRTIALEAVNKELEAFSYSVSHDLRAPLRAISGYSRILQEEYRAKLDSEAQHFLDRIRTNVERMGMLIDDLLAFSRLGRQPLRRREVQPASLVSDVIQELRQEFGGELRPTIRLEDLPPCLADPALLKRVYANLLENAVKFTRDCEDPQVSVGAVEDNNETIYYVKDNGVGFDMRYVDKLFGVFQRLHDPDRYEGTGIGLATSRRIIQRHGGRIWAESKVGQGTTFYFTIGDESMDDPLGG